MPCVHGISYGPGYRVWLRLGGKYRRVEWRKLSSPVPQATEIALRYGKRTMLSQKFACKILRCRSMCRLCKLPPTTLLETSISGSSSRCRRLQVLGFLFFVFLSFVKMHDDRRNLPQAAKAGVFSPRFLGGRELARNWQRWYELVVFCQVKLRSSEDVFQVDSVEMKCCQFLAVEVWWENVAELSWQVVRNKDWDQAFYPEAMRFLFGGRW